MAQSSSELHVDGLATPVSSANFTSNRSVATIFSVPSEMSRADSMRICRQMPTWMFFGLQAG